MPTCTRAPPRGRSSTISPARGSSTGSPASPRHQRHAARAWRGCSAKAAADQKIVVCGRRRRRCPQRHAATARPGQLTHQRHPALQASIRCHGGPRLPSQADRGRGRHERHRADRPAFRMPRRCTGAGGSPGGGGVGRHHGRGNSCGLLEGSRGQTPPKARRSSACSPTRGALPEHVHGDRVRGQLGMKSGVHPCIGCGLNAG